MGLSCPFQSAPRLAGSSTAAIDVRPLGVIVSVSIRSPTRGEFHDHRRRVLRRVGRGVSIRSPTRGEFQLEGDGEAVRADEGFNPLPDSRGVPPPDVVHDDAVAIVVSIRSPTRGEFHPLRRLEPIPRCPAGFNPLPDSRGVPLDEAHHCRAETWRFQSAPRLAGSSTRRAPQGGHPGPGFNPLPDSRGVPQVLRKLFLRKVLLA